MDSRTLKADDEPLRLWVLASQLEALGWMIIGASIGYFAQLDVQRYAEALGVRSRFNEIGGYWINLFDRDWISFWFDQERTRPLRIDLPLAESPVVKRMFESCLLEWYRLNSTASAAHATAQLSFRLPKFIDQGHSRIGYEDLAVACENEWRESLLGNLNQSAVFFAGYGQMIEFLHGFLEQRRRFRDNVESRVSEGFFTVVARLLKWRFLFFQGRTTHFAEVLSAYCDVVGLDDAESRQTYQRFVQSICSEWSDLQASTSMSAGSA